MTDALHKSETEIEYEIAKETVRRFLISEYNLIDISVSDYPEPKNYWRAVWEIEVKSKTGQHKICIAIPNTFPDELPSIYLLGDQTYEIPHINSERKLCTFDQNEAQPDAYQPVGIVIAVIEKAKILIDEGIENLNEAAYQDEFEAYWALQAKNKAISLVKISDDSKQIWGLRLDPLWKDYQILFVDKEEEGKAWLNAVRANSTTKPERILYLPIKHFGIPPFPHTNGQIYERLKKYDPKSLSTLLNYLDKNGFQSGVLFSLKLETGKNALGAWWHQKTVHRVFQGKKGIKQFPNVIPGFSSKFVPAKLLLTGKYTGTNILNSRVERVDQERLFIRTSGYIPRELANPVNIVGCGSIGSILAARLADSGIVEKFRLVDSQALKIENVARHYCGMSYINENKALAAAIEIRSHYPHLKFEVFGKSVLDILRNTPDKLEPASLTVIAIGELAVERRINKVSIGSKGLNIPHCYVWVEPHLIAGHAVLVRPNTGCFECVFDESFRFKHRVITDTSNLSLREVGCQTTYVPYSAMNAQSFVNLLTRFILQSINENSSQIFTWIGDLNLASSLGIKIESEWMSSQSFSTVTRIFNKNPECKLCQ